MVPSLGTPFFGDADAVVQAVQTQYLNGGYETAQAALDDAANQIALVTGLPIAGNNSSRDAGPLPASAPAARIRQGMNDPPHQ